MIDKFVMVELPGKLGLDQAMADVLGREWREFRRLYV
jgi:hypothetical protein